MYVQNYDVVQRDKEFTKEKNDEDWEIILKTVTLCGTTGESKHTKQT